MNVTEFSHTLLKDFMLTFPELVQEMKESDHNQIKDDFISDWHCEGDVWAHTMMVYSQAVEWVRKHPESNYNKELLVSALLHDIGKPAAREWKEDKRKVVFYGHSGISTFMAVNVLKRMKLPVNELFVLELINYHQILFTISDDSSKKALDRLQDKFNTCEGAILLNHINIHRQLDYAGNIAVKDDNVGAEAVRGVVGRIDLSNEIAYDETKPTATILVGLPGSGKSTIIKDRWPNQTIVSRDNCLMALCPGMEYAEAWKVADQQHVDQMHSDEFKLAIQEKKDFVIDRTNLTHKGRMKFIKQCGKAFNIHIVVLMPALDVLELRLKGREETDGKAIPAFVMKNMMKSFEMPYPTEAANVSYIFN